jgi:hypothetical protein
VSREKRRNVRKTGGTGVRMANTVHAERRGVAISTPVSCIETQPQTSYLVVSRRFI